MELNMESVALKSDVAIFQDTAKGECKTDIDSSTVSKILGIYAKCVNPESELKDNTVKYKAQVIYSICYVDTDKNVRKCEIGGEISGEIVGVNKDGYLSLSIRTVKTEGDVSSLKLIINAIFNVRASVYYQEKCDYVSGGENLILNKNDCEFYKGFGRRKSVYPIDEEFTLDYTISNVLCHKIMPIITAVQCGVGCIIVDGEVHISALLLQNDEKRSIIKEQRVVPFRAEIEYEEAMPSMIATAECFEKSFKTDISVEEENGKSTVNASIAILLEGEAFAVNTCNVSVDAFSLTRELNLGVKVSEKYKPLEQKNFIEKMKGACLSVDGIENATLQAIGFEKAEIIDAKQIKDCLEVNGVVSFTALFHSEDGEVLFRKLEDEFNVKLNVGENIKADYTVNVSVLGIDGLVTGKEKLECEYTLDFTVYGKETEKVKLLINVEDAGEKKQETSSISVYIPFPNEELWSLSKRLNTPPEEICTLNKDLQFPLTGKERIVIYRQKV